MVKVAPSLSRQGTNGRAFLKQIWSCSSLSMPVHVLNLFVNAYSECTHSHIHTCIYIYIIYMYTRAMSQRSNHLGSNSLKLVNSINLCSFLPAYMLEHTAAAPNESSEVF